MDEMSSEEIQLALESLDLQEGIDFSWALKDDGQEHDCLLSPHAMTRLLSEAGLD